MPAWFLSCRDSPLQHMTVHGEVRTNFIMLTEATVSIFFARKDRDSELPMPKGMSFGDWCLFFFPVSSCHGFLGHEVVHPPLGSPQA